MTRRSDTIPGRAYQPKRRYHVSKIGGGSRSFASIVSAVQFASLQARQSLTSPLWSVWDRQADGSLAHVCNVRRNGDSEYTP